jgi:hypothetical protein
LHRVVCWGIFSMFSLNTPHFIQLLHRFEFTPLKTSLEFIQHFITTDTLYRHGSYVDMLYSYTDKIEPSDRSFHTSLWFRAAMGLDRLVQKSIDEGEDINQKGTFDTIDGGVFGLLSPLHAAVVCGHPAVVKVLLENGASVLTTNAIGQSPIHASIRCDDEQSLELLLLHGVPLNVESHSGSTPLMLAVSLGLEAKVRMLLRYKANVLERNSMGTIPSDLPVDFPVIQALLSEEEENRHKCLAFAMSHHERLGVGSMAQLLDPEVLRMILVDV